LVRQIGRGRSGLVWEALDEHTGAAAAIKFFERRSGSGPSIGLQHPNIVTVYLTGVHNDVPYAVMELVDGVSLEHVLYDGPLCHSDAVSVASGVCQALQAAHLSGITHGNLKPANVFVSKGGAVKVADFTGRGDRAVDMYALGLLMEAMYGYRDAVVERLQSRHPFTAAETCAVLAGHRLPHDGEPVEPGGGDRERGRSRRVTIASGVTVLAVSIGLSSWFLAPSSSPGARPRQPENQAPSRTVPGFSVAPPPSPASAPAVMASVTASAAASLPAHASPAGTTGVDRTKAAIDDQVKNGRIHPGAAAALQAKLDQIARFQTRGQTQLADEHIAALKTLLAKQQHDRKVTPDGYRAIAAAIDQLS
jgi:serine/threonine protein kinase